MSVNDVAQRLAAMKLVNASVLQQLNCPVCLDTCKPPIYMCIHGHNICATCNTNLRECPVCRAPGELKSRNLALEVLRSEVLIPCKFKSHGCAVEMNISGLDRHHSTCDCRFQCLIDCDWVGKRSSILDHVQDSHPNYVENCQTPTFQAESFGLTEEERYIKMFKLENELFWIHEEYDVEESVFYFYSQYIGAKEDVVKYRYELSIVSPDDTMVLSYSGPPLSLDEDYKTSAKTFRVPLLSTAVHYIENSKLLYKRGIRRI